MGNIFLNGRVVFLKSFKLRSPCLNISLNSKIHLTMLNQSNDNPKLIPLNADIQSLIEGWLGLNGNGRLENYFTHSSNDLSLLEDMKKLLFQEFISQQGYETTKKAVRKYIKENAEKAEVLQDSYYDLVSDMYSQIDRAVANQNAIKLGLDYAIYEGGLTSTSRDFCKDHNGKVYTRDEIMAFNPNADLPNYNPIQDMGGIGCRHHLNWISYSVAAIFRPDLKR
jgi:hypothetical protein